MELLEFIFQSFWHFIGFFVILWLLCQTIVYVAQELGSKKPEDRT